MFTLDELKCSISKTLGISESDLNIDKTFKKMAKTIEDRGGMLNNISLGICNKFGFSHEETFTIPSKKDTIRSFYGHLKKEYQRNPKAFQSC